MDDRPVLADQQLRSAVEARLARLGRGFGARFGRRRRQRQRAELERIQHILAQFPWREYPYRYGRWQRAQRIVDLGFPSFKWSRTYDTFQLLDPASGRPIAELTADNATLPAPSGTLRFAGDPRVAGVYTPTTGGTPPAHDLRLALSAFADRATALDEALRITPGRGAAIGSQRFNDQLLADDDRRPWIAEQPGKPKHS
jgi:hypothetical protein